MPPRNTSCAPPGKMRPKGLELRDSERELLCPPCRSPSLMDDVARSNLVQLLLRRMLERRPPPSVPFRFPMSISSSSTTLPLPTVAAVVSLVPEDSMITCCKLSPA